LPGRSAKRIGHPAPYAKWMPRADGEVTDMDKFKILEIKQSVFESNDRQAELLRAQLRKDKVFLLNLMSSPGSGKTTTVLRTIEALKDEMRIGVLEADIDSDVDASTVARTGTKVIQLHSGGMCHLDADMTRQGLAGLGTDGLDFVILENIGNLICTAEFDTGASRNAMILSVPEGDDKPLKYPLMFSMVDVLLINKIDAMGFFDFNLEAVRERVTKMNPKIRIIPISARTGEGIGEWANWLRTEVGSWKQPR
jgi:hydrogenase nickel incorporation protein HypB